MKDAILSKIRGLFVFLQPQRLKHRCSFAASECFDLLALYIRTKFIKGPNEYRAGRLPEASSTALIIP